MSARCSLLGQRAVGRRRVANRCRQGWWRLSACESAWFAIDGQLRRVARAPQCPAVSAVADTNAPTLPPRHPRASERDGGVFNDIIGRTLFT